MKTNEQHFRKPHRHDGSNMHMDQHMMDGNNQMMPQDGMGRNNGQYMNQNGQKPPQGPGPQQSKGDAQQQTGQGAPQTTQN